MRYTRRRNNRRRMRGGVWPPFFSGPAPEVELNYQEKESIRDLKQAIAVQTDPKIKQNLKSKIKLLIINAKNRATIEDARKQLRQRDAVGDALARRGATTRKREQRDIEDVLEQRDIEAELATELAKIEQGLNEEKKRQDDAAIAKLQAMTDKKDWKNARDNWDEDTRQMDQTLQNNPTSPFSVRVSGAYPLDSTRGGKKTRKVRRKKRKTCKKGKKCKKRRRRSTRRRR